MRDFELDDRFWRDAFSALRTGAGAETLAALYPDYSDLIRELALDAAAEPVLIGFRHAAADENPRLLALVSAAFILINSKVGDLIGRKRAYVLGLLGYAVGAIAMTLAQNLTTILIFWAIVGGLGASLLLPAMQSLIHGNFEGEAKKRTYALVGAATGIAAAIGPLLGGFITTYLS